MYWNVCNVFQLPYIAEQTPPTTRIYTVNMHPSKMMLSYINRVQQIGVVLKAMEVDIKDKKMATANSNGLSAKYDQIDTILDVQKDESPEFI